MCTNCKASKTGSWYGCTTASIIRILVIVGGINWGLIGAGMLSGGSNHLNVVNILFGNIPELEALIYVVVGIAAVAYLFSCKCKTCKKGTCCSTCADKKD